MIKDARRRQRRRQRRLVAAGAGVLVAATVGWVIAGNSGSGGSPTTLPRAAAGAVSVVNLGGIVESTTTLGGDLWVLTCREHCSEPLSGGVRGELVELTAAGRVLRRIAVADPGAVAGGDGSIWLAHFYSGEVARLYPQTGHVVAAIRLRLPRSSATGGYRRFVPSAIAFSAGRVWVSTALGWTAELNPGSDRLMRMAYSSSKAASATAAGGLTWVADELDGVGSFSAASAHVTPHPLTWAGQPLDIATVAAGAGLVWALGSETNFTVSLTNPPTVSVVTAIDPRTGRIVRQWQVGNAAAMVLARGGAYVGDDRDGRILRLVPSGHVQVLHGPGGASLVAATAHSLWATAGARLLRIPLARS